MGNAFGALLYAFLWMMGGILFLMPFQIKKIMAEVYAVLYFDGLR